MKSKKILKIEKKIEKWCNENLNMENYLWLHGRGCWMCKKFKDPVLKVEKIKGIPITYINPKFIFHAYSTHGIPKEILKKQIKKFVSK